MSEHVGYARVSTEVVDELKARDVGFLSITEAIDTTTPQGTLQFQLGARWREWGRR